MKNYKELGLFNDIQEKYIEPLEYAYINAMEYSEQKYENVTEWEKLAILFGIKHMYHKLVTIFPIESFVKFIVGIKHNNYLFKLFYEDNDNSYEKLGKMIARKFISVEKLKPMTENVTSIFKDNRGNFTLYEYKVRNITFNSALSIEEFLNQMAQDGWEFVAPRGDAHYFRRKVEDDFMFL